MPPRRSSAIVCADALASSRRPSYSSGHNLMVAVASLMATTVTRSGVRRSGDARHQHPVAPGEITLDEDVVESRRAGQLRRPFRLVWCELEHQCAPTGIEPRTGPGDELLDGLEPRRAAHEG